MICHQCKKDFDERDLELSHDIPKYMEGKDIDGRHWLCIECHDVYERRVLKRCFKLVFHEDVILNDPDRQSLQPYMSQIKNSFVVKKWACIKAAYQVKEEVYGC